MWWKKRKQIFKEKKIVEEVFNILKITSLEKLNNIKQGRI